MSSACKLMIWKKEQMNRFHSRGIVDRIIKSKDSNKIHKEVVLLDKMEEELIKVARK